MHIVIIGNGISGITAARWIRKLSDHKITVISSESDYFFSRTALMYIYMGHMQYEDTKPYEDNFWTKNRIDLLNDHVTNIDFAEKKLIFHTKKELTYDKLIIAVGSKSNMFGWPGQDLDGVGGLYSLQDLLNMEKYSPHLKRAVIVGGGLIGIEMAEMFHSRKIDVTMLVREENYWDNILPIEEAAMIGQHIRSRHIELRLNTNLKEIVDDGAGKACAVVTAESGERIECGYVGLTAGVSPNVAWLKNTDLMVDRGIVVNKYLETNIEDVYAVGDCVQLSEPRPDRRAIEAVWYTGRMMGETVAHNVCDVTVPYDPGIWFNSAKFFDIEYQVYGNVPNKKADESEHILWQHADHEKSVRIIYDRETEAVTGFNLLGVRYRHEVCEKWLAEKTNIKEVLQNLKLAHFDPEFYKSYEQEILAVYNQQTGQQIRVSNNNGLNAVLQFLKG